MDTILARLSARARYSLTFDGLLRRWSTFVAQVEQGYSDSIYEYTNDLSTRDVLQEVLEAVDEPLRQKLTALVQPIDQRFEQTTREIGRPLTGGKTPEGRWWLRIPQRLSGELEDDLRSEGLV
jgi:hypothetical protein